MLIGIKDIAKLFAITVVACCAVFVCALFLNYQMDVLGIEDEITTPEGMVMYHAQVATGKVVVGVSGGCLVMTTVVMLMFYVKNYIDSHGKELGILKALGYSDFQIAKHFWVFGISVLIGAILGCIGAYAYLPNFYETQNSEGLLPQLLPRIHVPLIVSLLVFPTAFFLLVAVFYAFFKIRNPVMDLLREKQTAKGKPGRQDNRELPFLTDLRRGTLHSRKILAFFVGFSAFCFSAMTQMAMSMNDLSSETFAWMILSIGLILAYMTLLMALSSVVRANAKTIAMMKVFGYSEKECGSAVLGGYRPVSYIGFLLGTVYQYFLLRIMVDVVFADYEQMPEYGFDYKALAFSLILFVVSYELVTHYYARKIGKQSVKNIMLA